MPLSRAARDRGLATRPNGVGMGDLVPDLGHGSPRLPLPPLPTHRRRFLRRDPMGPARRPSARPDCGWSHSLSPKRFPTLLETSRPVDSAMAALGCVSRSARKSGSVAERTSSLVTCRSTKTAHAGSTWGCAVEALLRIRGFGSRPTTRECPGTDDDASAGRFSRHVQRGAHRRERRTPGPSLGGRPSP